MRLVILPRAPIPPLPLARMRAQRDPVTELHAGRPALHPRRSRRPFSIRSWAWPLPGPDLGALEAHTAKAGSRGYSSRRWRCSDHQKTRPAFIRTTSQGSNRYIVDYLAAEVFRAPARAAVQAFLLQTAVLGPTVQPPVRRDPGRQRPRSRPVTTERAAAGGVGAGQPVCGAAERRSPLVVSLPSSVCRRAAAARDGRAARAACPTCTDGRARGTAQHGEQAAAIDHALAAGDFGRAAELHGAGDAHACAGIGGRPRFCALARVAARRAGPRPAGAQRQLCRRAAWRAASSRVSSHCCRMPSGGSR